MTGLLLRGGTVVDGTGAPSRKADVAIRDGALAAIGADLAADGARVIDVSGRVVAPFGISAEQAHLLMLLFTRGRDYAYGEIRSWLLDAGFARVGVDVLPPGLISSLVTGYK